ncbi:unnamed protein product [Paramecium octaurelia]|uniref:Uncharacterized protein n=1 Tax=Paramecium octaurelia TaxID=43137 RepID=A0A8S1VAA5_PAROT|nr:unnamed protein product [Paramecium octaurelia]
MSQMNCLIILKLNQLVCIQCYLNMKESVIQELTDHKRLKCWQPQMQHQEDLIYQMQNLLLIGMFLKQKQIIFIEQVEREELAEAMQNISISIRGTAITMMTQFDVERIQAIENLINLKLDEIKFNEEKVAEAIKTIKIFLENAVGWYNRKICGSSKRKKFNLNRKEQKVQKNNHHDLLIFFFRLH